MIVGLGNPGDRYARTRHNVGFRAADALAGAQNAAIRRLKGRALTAEIRMQGQKILLAKPQTFMNLSGESVAALAAYYKIPPERILVLFDDISLPPGRIRVRASGSAGGHNGVKSIIEKLGSQNFPRIKIGVGAKPNPAYDLADWVLSTFSASEEAALAVALEHALGAAELILQAGVPAAANAYNGK